MACDRRTDIRKDRTRPHSFGRFANILSIAERYIQHHKQHPPLGPYKIFICTFMRVYDILSLESSQKGERSK